MNDHEEISREMVIVPWKNFHLTAVYENDKLSEIFLDNIHNRILGNIYVGKVQNIVKNINAAFIQFGKDKQQCGYYSLNENTEHFFLNYKQGSRLVPGDELLVQVIKDPIKTKPAMLTGKINLTGPNLVLTAHKSHLAVSSKITSEETKKHLKSVIAPMITKEFGFIIRTQAASQNDEILLQEAEGLKTLFEEIIKKAQFSKCFSTIYCSAANYSKYVQSHSDIKKITTDIPEVYQELANQQSIQKHTIPLVLYKDDSWPLIKLKSLTTHIERALNPQVWLKSGGFLMIQPTEAMVVIDVNTGRYIGKKDPQETFFKINMEAASEIARQLRLRNLSGIIIVDFIDMKDPENRRALLDHIGKLLEKDSVKTTLVDSTRLGLVEITRKKERPPLHELLGEICPKCHGQGRIYDHL